MTTVKFSVRLQESVDNCIQKKKKKITKIIFVYTQRSAGTSQVVQMNRQGQILRLGQLFPQ